MDKYYRSVPRDLLSEFNRFRQEHPLSRLELDDVTWEYMLAGDPAGPPLLLLPGALGTPESAWRTIQQLERAHYRVICPGYPAALRTMTDLADGIASVLAQEHIQQVFVVGGSYGGMLAQVFTRRHPGVVTRLVLSHTYPPMSKRAESVRPALRIIRFMPMYWLRRMLRRRMTGILPGSPSPQLLLIAGQIHETLDTRLTRQAALSTYLRMIDFDQQVFTPNDLPGWQGRTLILLSEDDSTTPASLRDELVALYPDANLHLFKGSGHATSVLESDEIMQVMDGFLRLG